MKNLKLFLAVIILSSSALAVTGTYTGETEKSGPSANYIIGFASESPSKIELEIPEKQGLNITYEEEFSFQPEDTSKVLESENPVPLKEIDIRVESIDPVKSIYEIPVVFRALRSNNESGTTPDIVQEREYRFLFETELSPDYGYEGNLIESKNGSDSDNSTEPDEKLDITEENTLTEENQSNLQGDEKNPDSGPNKVLLTLVVLVFGYTIYEAFT